MEKLLIWINEETNKSFKMKTDNKVFVKPVGTRWEGTGWEAVLGVFKPI